MKSSLFTVVAICYLFFPLSVLSSGLNHSDSNASRVVLAYVFPSNRIFSENEIDGERLTHINYAFANIADGRMVEGYPVDSVNLATLVRIREAHPHLKLLISVGGWSWSGGFSDMALTRESRSVFIQSAVAFLEKYNLDGLDLDWEYPGLPGNNNIHRPEDRQNFTALLRECREALDAAGGQDRHYMLTIATGAFRDYLDHTEMSRISEYLDLVNIMTYDFEGEWGGATGHHTNLFTPEDHPEANSAEKSVEMFLAAGLDREKLVIGAGFYGRGWGSVEAENNGLWQRGIGLSGADLRYYNLVENYIADPAFEQHWDESAAAPFLWNPAQRIFITYENPRSLRLKAGFVKENQLRGIMFWQYFSDHRQELLNVLADELLDIPIPPYVPDLLPKRPFPQGLDFPGTVKPEGIPQSTMDSIVSAYYDYWKSRYLRQGRYISDSWFVEGENTGGSLSDKGTSEGHGWGMVITALMAGHDPESKEIFDGLVRMYNATRSVNNPYLMAWLITEKEDAGGKRGSATDGDLDVAYGLLLAHEQWGSDGEINYLGLAMDMIVKGIRVSLIDTADMRLKMGDSPRMPAGTRSSDWMAGHMRAFYNYSGENAFRLAADTIYSLVRRITDSFSPVTGLVPDFISGNPPGPAPPNFLETEFDGTYNWNACRFPMRIAADYAHNGTLEAKETLDHLLHWLIPATGNDPAMIKPGYNLSGEPLENRDYSSLAYTAPFVAAGLADPVHAEWLTTGWMHISDKREGYYPDTINLLSMLLISGNWWAPGVGQGF